jgi:hypothetical protein
MMWCARDRGVYGGPAHQVGRRKWEGTREPGSSGVTGINTILKTAGTRGLALAGVVWMVASVVLVGAAGPAAAASTGTGSGATQVAARTADRSGCPGGAVVENRTSGGIPECKLPGSPEGPRELGIAEQQRGSVYTAGSGAVPAGAYTAAISQRDALPNAAGGASGWALQGKGPLDASQHYDAVGSPFPQTIADLGFKNLTGRITDIAYDPAPVWNSQRLFVSAAEGGVWESRDGGKSWRSIGDHLVTQSVGAIAWVPGSPAGTDDGTLVVGTGDNAQGRYNYNGHGIVFTNDDGNTWQSPVHNVTDPSQNFRIRVSPNDPHRIYAATSRGLFQGLFSPDFSSLDFRNLNLPTACTVINPATNYPCFVASNVTDVEVKTNDPIQIAFASRVTYLNTTTDTVAASVGSRFGDRRYQNPDGSLNNSNPKQTPQAGIYRSTNCTSTTCTFGFVTPPTHMTINGPSSNCDSATPGAACFPASDNFGRTTLAAAHGPTQNHGVLYAVVQDPLKENYCFNSDTIQVCQQAPPTPIVPLPNANFSTVLDGMYFSTDFGSTWIKVMDWGQLDFPLTGSSLGSPQNQVTFGYGPGIQSSYNNWVLVDPTAADANGNPTRLLFGLEEIWQSSPDYIGAALTPQTRTDYRLQKAAGLGTPPWTVIGRYWNSCGPFTFGEGINCNSVDTTNGPLGGSTTHPDQHAALFIPTPDGVNFFAGSDGGMFNQPLNRTHTKFDNNSWGSGISNNLNVLQPYNAEISKDGTIVAGLQDNGEMKINPTTGKMEEIFGGDGLMSGIDPDDSKNIIECYVHAICNFTNDGGLNWTRIDPGVANPRFNAPLQMDPTDAKHYFTGGRQIMERLYGYTSSSSVCIPTTPLDPTCQFTTNAADWYKVYDLGTTNHPGDPNATPPDANNPGIGPGSDNSATAIDVKGANVYVGFCGLCDVALEGVPFKNGIATNVGGSQPPVKGFTEGGVNAPPAPGWHIATAQGLPNRYITSVRMDPNDVNTIYVTLGGYQRVWVPPGAFGEPVDPLAGHVFKSTNHGENFTDVSGNLPNTPALWTVIHNGQLVVATDIGVFQAGGTSGGAYSVLGFLPATPVDTLRIAPGNPDLMIAALWGRGVWAYCFSGSVCPSNIFTGGPENLPNTAALRLLAPWALLAALVAFLLAGLVTARQARRQRLLPAELPARLA